MVEHTGQWKLEPTVAIDPETGGPCWWGIYEYKDGDDISGTSVAYLWPGPGFTHRNAFLALPDLLAALKLAKGRLSLLMAAELPGSDHPSATNYVLDQIDAALAKAKARAQ